MTPPLPYTSLAGMVTIPQQVKSCARIFYCTRYNNFSSIKKTLKDKLIKDLEQQGDPRILGQGDIFDQYPYSGENVKNFYSRYMSGEEIKTHWVNPSDFEK